MEEKRIYKAIVDIMGDMGAISKDKKNQQQGFMYRGVDDVMNVLQPLLKKHGVFVVPEVIEHTREERTTKSGGNLIYSIMKIRHHFIATDGSEVVSTTIGEGMDSADKSSNKALAIAFKYACFQVFCIPTEEMPDPDNETPPDSKPTAKKTGENKPKNEPKTNDNAKTFEPLTKSEMVQKWGVRQVAETIVWFEQKFNLPIEEWGEEETEMARAKLAEKKAKREETERLKAGLTSVGDADIPFPLTDE